MSYKTILKESLREIEKNRDKASALLEARKNEIYLKVPRIRDIDRELSGTGLNISKMILSGDRNPNTYIDELGKTNMLLQEEKKALLLAAGFTDDYLENVHSCSQCKDTGFIGNEKCICLKQKLINKNYSLSNLHDILKMENFEYFDIRYYSTETDPKAGISPRANMERIYQVCLDFVKNLDTEHNNLLFYGDTGLGKTFLCNCIAKDLLDAGKTVLYVTAPKLFKAFEDYRFNRDDSDEPDEYLEMVNQADLCIIDDLGTEFSTILSSSELFNIINSRILDNKSTIISTNLYPSDFETTYSERIISRFVGNYIMLKFFGKDIRISKKYTKKV